MTSSPANSAPTPTQHSNVPQALSDFADYAAKQERGIRYGAVTAGPSEPATTHSELDDLAEWADFNDGDTAPKVPLRDMLLGDEDSAVESLERLVRKRLEDGGNETVFHLGFDNTDSMALTAEDWAVAYKRLEGAAKSAGAACRLLYTKNVGGPEEVEGGKGKDKDCSGKVLIRKIPATADENIETRVVVVGNGAFTSLALTCRVPNGLTWRQSTPESPPCWACS
ncbi:hypothetical protein IMZ48_33815 [Candidatus Bathyarchaeota archaeon]|nr:hypothetical protein [Candidatus Bathyarchaeota archaeon]